MANRFIILISIFFIFITFQFTSCYGLHFNRETQEEFLKTYTVQPGTKLELYNRNGSVFVSTWDKDYVEVYAVKRSRYGKRDLGKVKIEVKQNGRLTVRTKSDRFISGVSVDYEIKLPGDVVVDRVENSNGMIKLEGAKGDARLITSNGSITVKDWDGYIDAKTSNGSIRIFGNTGIDKVETSNGSIEAEISRLGEDNVKITTSNGSIKLYISENINADLEMKTSNSRIQLNDVEILTRNVSKNYIKGKVGKGGNLIFVKTSNGSIDLYKLR
ncbi:MAG: hypothetical protein KKF20_05135 [Bacteroidetes bacterium]|nr:hypothetical protein [Bacteroidota bacterium]MBU1421577.1 hypothetical protein [Bacteroidota bacterium]MBU2471772.1 hypothetical protein [Bacteroidota bacterium]MBU2637086.1 hypothetical protein [Bacteroidota bacterium]MDI6780165.1 DUF4097 family beta strand repeat-containing protein [Bacteroidota bacterium]